MPRIPDSLARLLTYHENAAASIRATIALLQGQPEQRGKSSNGHSPTMHAALTLDKERRAKKLVYQREWRKTHPQKTHPRKSGGHTNRVLTQRRRTAETLGHFDLTEPKLPGELPFKPMGLPILVTRGYLKKKGPGYVRTAKPFHVNPKDAG